MLQNIQMPKHRSTPNINSAEITAPILLKLIAQTTSNNIVDKAMAVFKTRGISIFTSRLSFYYSPPPIQLLKRN